MRKITSLVSLLFSFVLMLAIGVSLAATPTGSNHSTGQTSAKASAKEMGHVLAPAEELSGTITMVNSADKEVTLVGSNGVPYDFQLTKKSDVELANQKIGVNALAGELNRQATIQFVPTSHGNLVKSIEIGAS
jgi:hypothetical protein